METRKRILIVDDDKEFSEEFREILDDAGYSVTIAGDGASAVNIASEVKPDLILLDLRMRLVSGFEVAGALKHSPATSRIPIIVMSGHYSIKEHEFIMTLCDIKKFLKKPVDPSEAVAEIREVLNGKGECDEKEEDNAYRRS